MNKQKEKRKPIPIKSVAELKRQLQVGSEFMATYHIKHPETVGLVRVVSEVHTNCIYSKIKDQPDHKWSTTNYGKGFRTDFEKADRYHFGETGVDVLHPKTGEVMYSFEVYGIPTMDEAVKAGWDEWHKNEKMAPKYREEYPPGTRIMLLYMDDPYAPVPPNTRGTVDHIDSQSQFMMHWDNGRTLALVPGKDSFRKLTEEELAEEQNENITESEDAPEMSM